MLCRLVYRYIIFDDTSDLMGLMVGAQTWVLGAAGLACWACSTLFTGVVGGLADVVAGLLNVADNHLHVGWFADSGGVAGPGALEVTEGATNLFSRGPDELEVGLSFTFS